VRSEGLTGLWAAYRSSRQMRSCEVQLAWADDEASEIRERANAQGIQVKDRGRVPADLVASFNAATLK
jgi:hypothetical protein